MFLYHLIHHGGDSAASDRVVTALRPAGSRWRARTLPGAVPTPDSNTSRCFTSGRLRDDRIVTGVATEELSPIGPASQTPPGLDSPVAILHQRAKGFCGPDSEFGFQGNIG
ncbi:hypothetical protein Bbelb_033070 [Branchiostoma belcheri]|nr:hypothetical protein Bbelb_033070 [Branchiostoma belcheri]